MPIAIAEASDFTTATTGRITPALVVDRVHHLRHAVALGLGREVGDQEGDDHAADDRNQDDQRAPGRRRGEDVGVVARWPSWPVKNRLWIRPIRSRKPTAPSPVTTPTTSASSESVTRLRRRA